VMERARSQLLAARIAAGAGRSAAAAGSVVGSAYIQQAALHSRLQASWHNLALCFAAFNPSSFNSSR
jgi:hypothetical protein